MLLALFQFTVGLSLLIWGADRLIFGAVNLAKHFHLPPLLIGLTIVAIGTSAPEIFISIMAVFEQAPQLAIGNAIGSNIANIGLVMGVCAIAKPLIFPSKLFKTEFPLLLFISTLIAVLLWDGKLSFWDGIICLICFIVFLAFYVYLGWTAPREKQTAPQTTQLTAWFWTCTGLILLPLSSDLLIIGAEKIALFLGVPKLFIGLTLIALGTSLPELATSLISTVKSEPSIAIGNIIGSNICNLTIVLTPIGLCHPTTQSIPDLNRDLIAMLIFTFLLVLFYLFGKNLKTSRLRGFLLLISYISYIVLLSLSI